MKKVQCLAYRIENEAGFDDNEYIRESLRSITEQVGLLRKTKVWFYDTDNMDFLKEGRLFYCEETSDGHERLLGESIHTLGVVQKVERPIQIRQSVVEEFSGVWPEEFGHQRELTRVIQAKRTRRAYLLNGCDLVWQKALWESGKEEISYHELRLSTDIGNEVALFRLALRLSRTLRLQFETQSMETRALHALTGELKAKGRERYAQECGNTAREWMDDLLLANGSILVDALNDFLWNPEDAEALHQMRIALRILRSSLSFGKELLEEKVYKEADQLLQQLGSASSEARDLEVLLESIRDIGDDQLKTLCIELEKRRKSAYREVCDFIRKGSATDLLTKYLSLVRPANAWTDEAWSESAVEYRMRMRGVWMERLIKRSRRFDLADMYRIHRLRIMVKKQRYVMRSMEAKDETKRNQLKLLKRLQEVLGQIHDQDQQKEILTDILHDVSDEDLKFAVGYYLGICSEREKRERETLGKRAELLLEHLRETEI